MHKRNFYYKQKLALYFDENFPKNIVEALNKIKYWKKSCKIISVFDRGNRGKEDSFQFNYCKKQGYILVTLDKKFWDDKKYQIMKLPGLIIISANKNNLEKITKLLNIIVSFFSYFPLPKNFIGNSKFYVSLEGCIMKGRDSRTQEIKKITIKPRDSIFEIAKIFNYF